MKDEILKNFLNSFIEDNLLADIKIDDAFEHFVNYNVVSTLYPRELNFEDLSTGGENDIALDGMAIIVNGNIVTSEEEVGFLLSQNGTLDVTFALIQSKTSPKFKGEQVGNFLFGVKSFFDDKPSIPENTEVSHLRSIKDKLYQKSINFERAPQLKLYFVTTGSWENPAPIIGKATRELVELEQRSLFRNKPELEFFDAEKLKATYREVSRKIVKEIPFTNHVTLPDLPEELNIRQSFVGSIAVIDYLSLISNNDGKLSRGLFYDNVRDFQGGNKVNKEIDDTLQSSTQQALLPLLNNGITIIAKKIDKIGSKLKLSDFQIVNGCQSSHVLFKNKDNIAPETSLILKVIETTDQEVTNKIIRATNRQTEVKDEAFESLKPFHKNLQEFYKAKSKNVSFPIYYERRSKEFLGHPTIKSYQVITLASQVKSYVATKLEQPQSTHRYFGELLESNKGVIFSDAMSMEDYYFSSLVLHRFENMLRSGKIYRRYKPFKYHVLYLTYKVLKKEEKDIQNINDHQLKPLYIRSCKIIEQVLKNRNLLGKDAIRSKDFTKSINILLNQ